MNKIQTKVYGEREINHEFIKWDEIKNKDLLLSDKDLKFKEFYLEKLKILNNLVKNRNGKKDLDISLNTRLSQFLVYEGKEK